MRLHGIIPLPSSRGLCVIRAKEGAPHLGRFPPLPMKKAPERLRFRGHDKIKKSVVLRREYNPSLKGYN